MPKRAPEEVNEGAPVKTSIVLTTGLLHRIQLAQDQAGSVNFSHFLRELLRKGLERPGATDAPFVGELGFLVAEIARKAGRTPADLVREIVREHIHEWAERLSREEQQLAQLRQSVLGNGHVAP